MKYLIGPQTIHPPHTGGSCAAFMQKSSESSGLLPHLSTLSLSGLGLVIFEMCPWSSVLWDLINACELYTEKCHYVTSVIVAHLLCTHVIFRVFLMLFCLNCLFCVNSSCYLISGCSLMSSGFVQLMLDNTVRDIKPQFECDLFSCFYLKDSGKGGLSHCEDFFMSLLSSYS